MLYERVFVSGLSNGFPERVARDFTWQAAAKRTLEAYRLALRRVRPAVAEEATPALAL